MGKRKRIIFDNLVIEVTRRCNMACAHCMRGDAQNVDIPNSTIDIFLKNIYAIYSITFTGGEPTLNIPAIRHILQVCKRRKIQVYNFYIVTNGKQVTPAFIRVLIDWYIYCYECSGGPPEDVAVTISQDKYHEDINPEAHQLLSALSFYQPGYSGDFKTVEPLWLDIGRAKNLTTNKRQPWEIHDISCTSFNHEIRIDDNITLTVNGEILAACDYEYNDTDKLFICNAADFYPTILKIAEDPQYDWRANQKGTAMQATKP